MEVNLTNAKTTEDILSNAYQATTQPHFTYRPSVLTANEVVKKSNKIIFSISSVFPFDLFPDTLTIQENKVKIIFHHFPMSYQIHAVLFRDITDVVVDTHLFLSTLTMIDSSNYRFPIEISVRNLQIDDALRARDIIQDLVAAQRQRITIPNGLIQQ